MANPLYDALFAPLEGRQTDFLILADGRRISGDAFLALVARTAHALRAAGLGQGDRIAVQVAKSPEALAVYGAAVALGAVFLPLNTAYQTEELEYFIGNATPRIFLCDGGKATALAPICADHGAHLLTLNADGSGSLADLAAGQPGAITPVDREAGDLAALLYTSGTTGRSKGAMLTQRNLLSNAEVLADLWRFTDRDVLLHALPIFHSHGLFVACNVSLLAGGAMIFLPGFDLEAVLRLLPQATAMMGVPTFYTRLLDDARFDRGLAAHMRLFVSGSAPLLAETHASFAARSGHRILERYGMTETNMNTSNPYEGDRRAGTVGLPLPGVEARIMAEGVEVPPGEVGVIEVRGPNVFQGYWQMPEKTAEELRADGWFITGDLGVVDAEGYVQIVGRQKDLVISGGFNVYPKEVELVLDEVPGVLESAVIGVPHPDFGEAVFAVLVPRPGVVLQVDAVLAAIEARLARFKQPKAAVVLAELPRNAMGKVQKAQLRAEYGGWFLR
ncbi:malonate--CoA ligase [Rhodobacter ferrooxidans]|uniref:AMP-dependent synthetase and ligase n=1 Tax=Rhodobacter ferrooxidans TaxID=371731 RepID=C8RYG4_9RHOB|nr:malonyl-CoA synthase [Rhodobacter sp. SW2]EEW26152.1 AMP-dependent synthetase and ligase [Rhodobacter sp. SW2]